MSAVLSTGVGEDVYCAGAFDEPVASIDAQATSLDDALKLWSKSLDTGDFVCDAAGEDAALNGLEEKTEQATQAGSVDSNSKGSSPVTSISSDGEKTVSTQPGVLDGLLADKKKMAVTALDDALVMWAKSLEHTDEEPEDDAVHDRSSSPACEIPTPPLQVHSKPNYNKQQKRCSLTSSAGDRDDQAEDSDVGHRIAEKGVDATTPLRSTPVKPWETFLEGKGPRGDLEDELQKGDYIQLVHNQSECVESALLRIYTDVPDGTETAKRISKRTRRDAQKSAPDLLKEAMRHLSKIGFKASDVRCVYVLKVPDGRPHFMVEVCVAQVERGHGERSPTKQDDDADKSVQEVLSENHDPAPTLKDKGLSCITQKVTPQKEWYHPADSLSQVTPRSAWPPPSMPPPPGAAAINSSACRYYQPPMPPSSQFPRPYGPDDMSWSAAANHQRAMHGPPYDSSCDPWWGHRSMWPGPMPRPPIPAGAPWSRMPCPPPYSPTASRTFATSGYAGGPHLGPRPTGSPVGISWSRLMDANYGTRGFGPSYPPTGCPPMQSVPPPVDGPWPPCAEHVPVASPPSYNPHGYAWSPAGQRPQPSPTARPYGPPPPYAPMSGWQPYGNPGPYNPRGGCMRRPNYYGVREGEWTLMDEDMGMHPDSPVFGIHGNHVHGSSSAMRWLNGSGSFHGQPMPL